MRERYEKAQAFLANLSANCPELPFEPSLLPDLFEATSDSSAETMDHIAALVDRSQGLASRILRQANSAYYGIQTEISSLGRALRLLGLNEVRNIILQLGVASVMKKIPLPKSFPFEKLWEHQLFAANIARSIARNVPHIAGPGTAVFPDDLYAAGLLHDMGKTMLAALCPADWESIHNLAVCESIPFHQAEENYWGLDHAVVGARLLTFWGIPERLTELVNCHHSPQLAKPEFQAQARLLAAANLLAHNLDTAEPEDEDVFTVPESVTVILPEDIDPRRLQESFAASCNLERVRDMAKTAMGI